MLLFSHGVRLASENCEDKLSEGGTGTGRDSSVINRCSGSRRGCLCSLSTCNLGYNEEKMLLEGNAVVR